MSRIKLLTAAGTSEARVTFDGIAIGTIERLLIRSTTYYWFAFDTYGDPRGRFADSEEGRLLAIRALVAEHRTELRSAA